MAPKKTKPPKRTVEVKHPKVPPATFAVQEAELTKAIFPQFEGMGLTAKQQTFVVVYCRPDCRFNGTRAYIEAYEMDDISDYMTAAQSASRLLKNVKIQRAISIQIKTFVRNHEALAEAVLESWTITAFFDPFDVLNASGPFVYLKSQEDIPDHVKPLIQSIENTQMGVKVTLCNKDRAKENIAKALGLFTENTRHVDESYETLVQRLAKQEGAQDAKTD